MKKSDKSIRSITLASINRSLMPGAVCKFTKTFDDVSMSDILLGDRTIDSELPVACTFLDKNNYTLVTTQQVISYKDGTKHTILFPHIKSFSLGDFKGINNTTITLGRVTGTDEATVSVFIETGQASMIIVKAIRTIMNLMEKAPS